MSRYIGYNIQPSFISHMPRPTLIMEGGEPYLNFINSLRAEETKNQYINALGKFLAHYKISLKDVLALPTRTFSK